jgi:hypothetical protein
MLRDKALILLFLLVLAMLLVPFVHADDDQPASHARIVRLSYVEGQVQVSRTQGGGYQNATMNVPLVQGDQVRTGNDGWVEIQFENGSNIRLAPESVLTFSLMTRFASGATGTEVNLDQGEAEFSIAAGDDDGPFRVNVRQRVISLKHTSRFRVTTENSNPLEVVVWRGEVSVYSPESGQEAGVKKHEVFTLDPMDANHYDLERDVQADDLDTWASQRDQYLQAFSNTGRAYTQSPYQYGVSDLSYYGQYYNVAGCGFCWQPSGVGFNWDPFMNGYWYGNTWVSAYPWGWMPYRFGQWVFVPGFGWAWQPGLWNQWVPIPRVVNPPAGFRPPVPPRAAVSLGTPGVGKNFQGIANNPALTTTTGKDNKLVISNEHVPAAGMKDSGDAASGATAGGNATVASTGQPVGTRSGRHAPPPVIISPAPQPTTRQQAFHPAPPQPVVRPQASNNQAHSYNPPPRASSPPPISSAPAGHATSTGGGTHH